MSSLIKAMVAQAKKQANCKHQWSKIITKQYKNSVDKFKECEKCKLRRSA